MFNLPTNINKRERIVRGTIGGLLVIFALLGLHVLVFLVGALLIAEAFLSYCGIVDLVERFKLDADKPTKSG